MVILVLGLLTAVLIMAVLYQQFAFRAGIRRKLRQLRQSLQAILDEDRNERVMVFTDDRELQELAEQMNRLLDEKAKSEADFRRLEMASRKMLSNISHDLKTPLTVIRGYLEILRARGGEIPAVQAESERREGTGAQAGSEMQADSDRQTDLLMLLKAEQKTVELMELIDSFFSLAKLEAGDTEIALSPLDICEVCRESVLDFYEMLTGADFQVEVQLPESPILVQGNREALQRILSNLISNVIRYGTDGKYLGLFLRTDEQSAYIDVVDQGKGIDSAFAESVFERLFTMEDSRSRSVQGNGLGLTIAKNLAEQMGGGLALQSRPHVRTVFTVTLRRKMP